MPCTFTTCTILDNFKHVINKTKIVLTSKRTTAKTVSLHFPIMGTGKLTMGKKFDDGEILMKDGRSL